MVKLKNALLLSLLHMSNAEYVGIGDKVTIYIYTKPPEQDLAPKKQPLLSRHPSLESLRNSLETGDPASIVAAVDIVAIHEPASIELPVIDSLKQNPFRTLKKSLLRVLGACESEASFLALVDANPDGSHELRQNRFPGACAYIEAFSSSDPIIQDYKRLEHPTMQAWAQMSSESQVAWSNQAAADASVYTYDELNLRQTFLYYLGERGCRCDLAWLRSLWTTHPAKAIRLGAGHALLNSCKGEQLNLLARHWASRDRPIYSVALAALVMEAPASAASRLTSLFSSSGLDWKAPENAGLLGAVLETLTGHPHDSKEHPWVLQDYDWIAWFLELKAINGRRQAASDFLSMFPKSAVLAAQRSTIPVSKAQGAPVAQLPDGQTLVQRFANGDGEKVWDELTVMGALVRNPQILPHADAIAEETMTRVRRALETLASRLTARGYVFFGPCLWPLDRVEQDKQIAALEKRCGQLPLSLKAMYRYVGGCDFRGYHPEWPLSSTKQPGYNGKSGNVAWYTNPLVLTGVTEALETVQDGHGDVFTVALSGDEQAKAGFSAGQYEVVLPAASADVRIEGEPKARSLVAHLRHALTYGGFLGFESIESRPQQLLTELTQGLPVF